MHLFQVYGLGFENVTTRKLRNPTATATIVVIMTVMNIRPLVHTKAAASIHASLWRRHPIGVKQSTMLVDTLY